MNHLLSFANLQRDVFQGELEAFTVLEPVVLELDGAALGPSRGQRAALCTPGGLYEA